MNTNEKTNSYFKTGLKKNIIKATIIICPFVLLLAFYSLLNHSTETIPQKKYVSAYEKLADGVPINILVVGDSIAAGAGSTKGNSWAAQLPELMYSTYGSDCNLTNISMGGNTSIAGIMREQMLDDGINYDMVIICYGENDTDDDTFSSNYEGIIRTAQTKYPGCSIICILESSQRTYTNKMAKILDIAKFHHIPVADTINAFETSSYEYEDLVNAPDDLTHPNDKGHKIYLDTIAKVISDQVATDLVFDTDTHQFDRTAYYSKSDLRKINNKTFELTLDTSITGNINIYRSYVPGENGLKITADDTIVYDSTFEWNYQFEQEHIDTLTESPVLIENKIIIEFSSKEQAKRFNGIMLSDIEFK